MIRFECDYGEGAAAPVLDALCRTNLEQTPGYGEDTYCEQARERIRALCQAPDADVQFLVGATQANFTVIDAALKPWQGVLCADSGHIHVHETGAVEATGHKCLTLPNHNGKITAAQVRAAVDAHWANPSHEHEVQPGMVYISNPTEWGTLYSKNELTELSQVCRACGLYLFVDGARMAYGLTSPANDLSLQDYAALCDVFYLGGTKCGALFGEAVVITNDDLKLDGAALRKYGPKLYINGDLTLDANSKDVLGQVEFLRVSGSVKLPAALVDAFQNIDAEYNGLRVVKGTLITDRVHAKIGRDALEQAAAKLSGGGVKGRHIPQGDLGLRPGLVFGADVDIELVQLGDGLLLLPAHQVVSLQSHHAGDALGPHPHRLAQKHPAVKRAHGVKFQIALVGDAAHHEAHLIHVGTEHDLVAGGFSPLLGHDQIAQGVHPQGIGIRLGLRVQVVPHGILPAGHAVQSAEGFQQLLHRTASFPRFSTKAASSWATPSISARDRVSTGVCIYFRGRDSTEVATPSLLICISQPLVPVWPDMTSS